MESTSSILSKQHKLSKKIKDIEKIIGFPIDMEESPWIAGGFCRKTFFKEKLGSSDIDIFFKDEQKLEKALINIQNNVKILNRIFARRTITLECGYPINRKIQFITKPFDSFKELLSRMDFTMSSCGMDANNYYYLKDFVEHNNNKILYPNKHYSRINHPRITKLLDMGYRVTDEMLITLKSNRNVTDYFYD